MITQGYCGCWLLVAGCWGLGAGGWLIVVEKNHGTGSPASRKRSRVRSLWRAMAAASVGFPGRPSACATRAAITVGRSPTTRMPSIGRKRVESTIASTARGSS
ncbi:MAG: hypothetical protein DMG01_25860 [Acidobacteria bacterium]|nr:MAG: hypothetical protein DMG01_25860 [Acidobacteriota bacterium]